MSDQTPSLYDIPEDEARRLFEEAINEVVAQNHLTGNDADMLRLCSWAAYQRIDMKALGMKLRTGEITMADAMAQCLPTVTEIMSTGMQTSKTLH